MAATSAALVAAGLSLAGAAPAQADDGEHRSHALAELINLDALGIDAAEAVTAEQNYLDYDGEGPDTGTIDAGLLNQLVTASLGGVSLPISLDESQIGALSAYAHTPEPDEATASTGTIGSDGAIDVGGTDPYGYATVDLTAALAQLGLDTEGVVDQLSLELGAIASQAQAMDGEITSDYTIAGARLVLDSPLIGDLSTTLNTALSEISDEVNLLLGEDGELQQALDLISGPTVGVSLLGVNALSIDTGFPHCECPGGPLGCGRRPAE